MFKKNIFSVLFVLIILLAAFLRLYNLSNFPVGFHIDEASLGYNAYSLMLTGKDDNGNKFPLYVDIFGDNRPSGYHFVDILPVKIFGLNEFATRLPGALFGVFSTIAIFVLTNSIFKNRKISLISSFLLAVSPWNVSLSRASAETIIALFLIMLGFGLVILSIDRKRISYLSWGSLLLILSFFFYHTPRVFVPFLFLTFCFYLYKTVKINKAQLKRIFVSAVIVSLFSFLLVFKVSGGTGRFIQVSIFNSPGTKLVTAEQEREDGVSNVSVFTTRLFHNKVVSYSGTFFENYLTYFSGDFLFLNGGLPIWYKIPGIGLIYIVELPFILIGLFYLFAAKNPLFKFLLLWILISPITVSLTVDDVPNIQRAIVLFPALEICAAFGIYAFYNSFKFKKQFTYLLTAIFIFNVAFFLHQYFVHAKVHRTWFRNNGFNQAISEVKKSYDSYDHVVITKTTGGLYPLVLFYMKYDPATYQNEGSPKDPEYKGFGKFIFVPQDCPYQNRDPRFPKGKTIFVERGDCPDVSVQSKTIKREDGTNAYKIVYEL